VIIEDREGDIYEQFATIPDECTDLIIPGKSDRNLAEGGKLFNKVGACEVADIYDIVLKETKERTGKKERRTWKFDSQKWNYMHQKESRVLPHYA
jgi:hypothetical protein